MPCRLAATEGAVMVTVFSRQGGGNAVVGYTMPGWRLLLFVARRRMSRRIALAAVLVVLLALAAGAIGSRLASQQQFTLTLVGLDQYSGYDVGTHVELYRQGRVIAEADLPDSSDASSHETYSLRRGDYKLLAYQTHAAFVSRRANDGVWATVHLDRDLSIVPER
jgi:hypothetical protein